MSPLGTYFFLNSCESKRNQTDYFTCDKQEWTHKLKDTLSLLSGCRILEYTFHCVLLPSLKSFSVIPADKYLTTPPVFTPQKEMYLLCVSTCAHCLCLFVFVSLKLSPPLSGCVNSVFISKHFSSIRADSSSKCLLKIKIHCQTEAVLLLCVSLKYRECEGERKMERGSERQEEEKREREREKLQATI